MNVMRSKTVVAVSGGFDPPHQGHIQYFLAAKKLGDLLVVLVDSDEHVATKHKVMMRQEDRASVIRELRFVDMVLLSKKIDVSDLLEALRPDIYAVGPDHRSVDTIPEYPVCLKYDIKMTVLDIVKANSSTQLLENYYKGQ